MSADLPTLLSQVKTRLKIDQNVKICLSIAGGGQDKKIDDPTEYKTHYWERAETERLVFDVVLDIGAPGFEILVHRYR